MEPKISFITSLYRGEKYLEAFLKYYIALACQNQTELVLIHNDPTDEELRIINKYWASVKHGQHVIVPREGVYASWNRAVQAARGVYLGMWNIDDRRYNDGIVEQMEILDKHTAVSMVSGDYLKVFSFGASEGVFKRDPVKKNSFKGIYKFNNGCFILWRKSLHDQIGYFDEQLKVAGDWDFWMRATAFSLPTRAETLLGAYLREPNVGLSKSTFANTELENYTIKARYYNWFIANIYAHVFNSENRLRIKEHLAFGKFQTLKTSRRLPFFSELLSIFFFWTEALVRFSVELRYKIIQKRKSTNPTVELNK